VLNKDIRIDPVDAAGTTGRPRVNRRAAGAALVPHRLDVFRTVEEFTPTTSCGMRDRRPSGQSASQSRARSASLQSAR
jgi:hypothetical protein